MAGFLFVLIVKIGIRKTKFNTSTFPVFDQMISK